MLDLIKLLHKAYGIVIHRLQCQGFYVTLLWAYARGLPKITGVPILRYSQITPLIYVGPQYGRKGKQILEALGITGGVNLRREFDDAAHNLSLSHYCYLPTIDEDAPSLDHLHQGVTFIEKILASGGKVYIHCAGGVGRAPTLGAAYFISQGMSLDEALTFIRKTRPFIDPTPVQLNQLQHFAAQVKRPS